MAKKFVPHICGDNEVYIPDRECTDCEQLEKRVQDLEDTRLVQEDILAGEHITVDYAEDSNEVTINADLSNYYTQAQVDHLISQVGAYEEVEELPEEGDKSKIYLVPIEGGGYERWIYTDDGWKDLGSTQITLDKQSILNALGYEETTISMTDVNNNTVTRTVLIAIE